MYQYRQHINKWLACAGALVLLGNLLTSTVNAADEDIDIPYTDTYGYVYDPATGTFIKQNPATAETVQPTQAVTESSAQTEDLNINSTTLSVPAKAQASETTTDQNSVALLPGLLLLLLAIGGLTYVVTARNVKKANTEPH